MITQFKYFSDVNEDELIKKQNYLYYNECEAFIKNLIDKYGYKTLNRVPVDFIDREEISNKYSSFPSINFSLEEKYFSYALPYDNSMALKIKKENLNKFHFRYHDSDDGILFRILFLKSNLYYKKPIEIYDKRRKRYIDFDLSRKRYEQISFADSVHAYTNINDGLKLIENLCDYALIGQQADKFNL